MIKFYQVKMPNGETWRVPLSVIEKSVIDCFGELPSYMAEGDHIDHDYAEEWAQNNMNWSDVKEHAELVERDVDYEDYWCNGEGQIV